VTARHRAIWVFVATVASVLLTLRLGFWQLDRAQQKLNLQAGIDANAKLPALGAEALLADAQAAQAQVHRQVRLRGHWLQDKTVYLDNRPMSGRFGFLLVTPLRLEGRTEAILVQRGWAPRDAADRSRLPPLPPLSTGSVEVLGRLTAAPSKVYQLAGDEKGLIRQNLEVGAYGQEIAQSMLPLTVLQLDSANAAASSPAADGLLRDWPAPDLGLHKHYGYAFQWFALSALLIGLYVWFQTIRPRLRARRQP
jgi:surfeit locus 1 family protein